MEISVPGYNLAGAPAKIHIKYTYSPKTLCVRPPPRLATWEDIEPGDVNEDAENFCKTCRRIWKEIKELESRPTMNTTDTFKLSPTGKDSSGRLLKRHLVTDSGRAFCGRGISKRRKRASESWCDCVDEAFVESRTDVCRLCKQIAFEKPIKPEEVKTDEEKFFVVTGAHVYTLAQLLKAVENAEEGDSGDMLRHSITDLTSEDALKSLRFCQGAVILRLKDLKPVKAKMTFDIETADE